MSGKNKKSKFSTDREIKLLKALEKDYSLTDEKTQGLQLRVKKSGSKQWVYRYSSPTTIVESKVKVKGKEVIKHIGKQRNLGLGTYPEVSLANVRDKVAELKALIKNGIDPNEQKKRKERTKTHSTRKK